MKLLNIKLVFHPHLTAKKWQSQGSKSGPTYFRVWALNHHKLFCSWLEAGSLDQQLLSPLHSQLEVRKDPRISSPHASPIWLALGNSYIAAIPTDTEAWRIKQLFEKHFSGFLRMLLIRYCQGLAQKKKMDPGSYAGKYRSSAKALGKAYEIPKAS